MAPLFKEATLGAIDLGEEEFIDACKNLIKNSTIPQRFLIINRNLTDRTTKQSSANHQVTGKPVINQVSNILSYNNDYANSDVFQRLAIGRETYLKGKAPPAQKKKPAPKPASPSKKPNTAKTAQQKKTSQAGRQEEERSEPLSEQVEENQEEHSHNLNEDEGNSGGGSPDKIYKQQSQISERPSEQNVTSDPENTHPYAGEHEHEQAEEEHHEAAEEEHQGDQDAGIEEEEQEHRGDEEADHEEEN